MAVVFLLITVSMVAVSSDCAISKSADHIAPALALPLKARDRGDGGLSNCNPFRRSTVFHIDVAAHRNRLKELHVRHNLKVRVLNNSPQNWHFFLVSRGSSFDILGVGHWLKYVGSKCMACCRGFVLVWSLGHKTIVAYMYVAARD